MTSLVFGFGIGVLVAVLGQVLGDMATDEVRGWLDVAPRAILRLASACLNREQREQLYHEDWLPELQFIMQEAETRPITRAVRAIRFALGILVAARELSRLRPPTPPAAAPASTARNALGAKERVAEDIAKWLWQRMMSSEGGPPWIYD